MPDSTASQPLWVVEQGNWLPSYSGPDPDGWSPVPYEELGGAVIIFQDRAKAEVRMMQLHAYRSGMGRGRFQEFVAPGPLLRVVPYVRAEGA